MRRTTCLRCEQEGRTTNLVPTWRGGICPVHEPNEVEQQRAFALALLGLPARPVLANRGTPTRR